MPQGALRGRTPGNTAAREPRSQAGLQCAMPSPPTPPERRATWLRAALRHDRTPVILLLILFPLVCWWWIVVMARDMYGPMTGASAWMMSPRWDAPHLALLWARWAVMMTGMLLPSS